MSDKIDTLLGWHFCTEDKRLGYDDGREIIEGETLRVEGKPVLCKHGLHASERIIDALKYAPGPILCRVELSDGIVHGDDKAVAHSRETLWMFNATNALRDFAATVAEQTLMAERAAGREPDPRSWAAVQFVRDLLAGKIKEEDQDAAWAAWSAAWSAARAAAESAVLQAESAAKSAAWSAARSAESAAARSAESAAAAAKSAAWSATESAAWSATESAQSAAWTAARAAAESAVLQAESTQNDLLLQIIEKWRNK